MSLPTSCGGCVFWLHGEVRSHCLRHAPGAGELEQELVHWPPVREDDCCGAGDAGDEPKPPQVVACGSCLHWRQPGGEPVQPTVRQGRSVEWWRETGYCVRFAPSPSTEERRRTHWRVTNAAQGCGDGVLVEAASDAGVAT